MAATQETTGSRLTARVPALLLLLLAAIAAPAQARSAPENRAGEKSAQNAELSFSPTPQTLELQRENATAQRYDASGDSFAAENAGTTVIGHYPDYVNLAQDLKANYFSIPTEQWNAMTEAEQWAANQKFLDEAIARGDTFRLATPIDQVRPGSYLEKEIQYLTGKGFQLNGDGSALVPPGR